MYGLQLLGKIRWTDQDLLQELQKTQNKMLRFLNKTKISDKISTKHILSNLNMSSVNQMNAKIKLTEMWKANNVQDYPLKVMKTELKDEQRTSRSATSGKLIEYGHKVTSTFINDSTRAWNKAPNNIKQSKTLFSAKKLSKCLSTHYQYNCLKIWVVT